MSTGRYRARGRGRAAVYTCGGAQGITLLELLVVLAILGLMAAVAIPTFARFGFFSRNETQQGARELYKLLSVTRVLAASNRVDTAVAYLFTFKPDSLSGQSSKTIEAFAVVQNVPENYKLLVDGNEVTGAQRDRSFVPVEGMQGASTFTSMPQDTALLVGSALPDGAKDDILIYRGEYEYDPNQRYWVFRTSDADKLTWRDADGTEKDNFPAHVFTPSGRMQTDATKERFTISVGYPPDADPVERFSNPDSPAPEPRTINLELYRGTGRVQIVREES